MTPAARAALQGDVTQPHDLVELLAQATRVPEDDNNGDHHTADQGSATANGAGEESG